jgi:hypothetical protein
MESGRFDALTRRWARRRSRRHIIAVLAGAATMPVLGRESVNAQMRVTCLPGLRLSGGRCIPEWHCENDADCPVGWNCTDGFCGAESGCLNDDECPGVQTCWFGECR